MKTIIVIPTYNEKDNIIALLPQIFALGLSDLEVIIVDDNSPDKTAEAAELLKQTYPQIHLLKRRQKLGLGSAYIMGFKKALSISADLIMEMDADFSHCPSDIPKLISACTHANMSIGSRKITGGQIIGWNKWRKFISNGAMLTSRLLLGLKTKDVTAGFRCYQRQVLEKIDLEKIKSNGYAFQEEILYRVEKNGFKVIEIPVIFTDRRVGQSKLSKKDVIDFFLTIFRLKFGK